MTLTILVGDLLLVYRCYVIWQHRWWVAIFPGLTCVAAFVLGIIPLAVTTHGELTEYYYELARVFLTVLTNLMVTSLISFYLIVARRELSKVLPGKDLNLYTGVVAILIESALPLTLTIDRGAIQRDSQYNCLLVLLFHRTVTIDDHLPDHDRKILASVPKTK
ncbi:hypothetical protein MD484_g1510, partial [Candolleomyces efflorescens]